MAHAGRVCGRSSSDAGRGELLPRLRPGAGERIQALQQEVAGLRGDIAALRAMLQQAMGPRPAPAGGPAAVPAGPVKPLTITGRPTKGNPSAEGDLVEYADYECPYCGQLRRGGLQQIEREYIKSNKIQYVFKNYPIAQLHPASLKAHVAAACAGDQGHYWEMHDKLFAEQRNLNLERYTEHAEALKLDLPHFVPAWKAAGTKR